MVLPDPRLFPSVVPQNPLLHVAQAVLDASSADERACLQVQLNRQIQAYLSVNDDVALNVSLQLASSQSIYKTLWHTTLALLETPGVDTHTLVFALPVVLVAGAKQETTLPAQLSDPDAIVALLREHGVVHADAECCLSGKWVHPDALGDVRMSQWLRLNSHLADVARGVPLELPGAALTVKGDGVFLRFLVGVVRQAAGGSAMLKLGGAVGEWAMPVMRVLSTQLATPGVTLFPIPLVPNVPPEALRQGIALRQEVGLQVFASNIIRTLRAESMPIVAIASSHEGDELRFTISTPGDDKNWAAQMWRLAPLDSVARISENFAHLMAECQVDDVRFLPSVFPAQCDGIPFFITCNTPLDA